MLLNHPKSLRRALHRNGLPHFAAVALGLRPARSGEGRPSAGSTSSKSRRTGTRRTLANASSVSKVTFSSPRSTRPTYDRSILASRASRSCDRPCSTRSFLRFHPMIARVSIYPRHSHNHCLTIHGLMVPYLSSMRRSLLPLNLPKKDTT